MGRSTVLRLRGAVVIGALRAMAKAWAVEADRLDARAGEAKTLDAELTRFRAAWLRLGAALLGQA